VSADVARSARMSIAMRGRRGMGTGSIAVDGKHIVSVALQTNIEKGEVDIEKREVVLKRWELATEKALEPMVLTRASSLTATLSTDYRTVLVRVRETVEEDETAYWRIYSTRTGKELGTFEEVGNMSLLTALGERIFYVATGPTQGPTSGARPRGLFALDVRTGKQLWAHSLEPRRNLPREGGRRGGVRP
jgi:hypothetical protein